MIKLTTWVISIGFMLIATQILDAQTQSGAQLFWNKLKQCDNYSYHGDVTSGKDHPVFKGQQLLMHVRVVNDSIIQIPFDVGTNRSRTWVLKLRGNRILLKHDHRHEDGSEDAVTQYGGWSSHSGSDSLQIFPADQYTRDLIPYAAVNVWWMGMDDAYFTYNLSKIGSNNTFSVQFDLRKRHRTHIKE